MTRVHMLPCWLIRHLGSGIQEWGNFFKRATCCNFLEAVWHDTIMAPTEIQLPIGDTSQRHPRCMLCSCGFRLRQLHVSAA